jgi:hypothetical protein
MTSGVPDPQVVLDQARDFARQGRYEEALRAHAWFHDHALEHDEAQYGVRLSFALADWVELGKKHPPALEALRRVRDGKEAAVRAGDTSFDLFHDVVAINECLGQARRTALLFLGLPPAEPELDARRYDLAEEALVSAGAYQACSARIPDPAARFEAIRAARRSDLGLAAGRARRVADQERQYAEWQFDKDTERVVAILEGAGRAEEAARVSALAQAEREAYPGGAPEAHDEAAGR